MTIIIIAKLAQDGGKTIDAAAVRQAIQLVRSRMRGREDGREVSDPQPEGRQPDGATGGIRDGRSASRPPSGHDLLVIIL
jgi:hypothetical protein